MSLTSNNGNAEHVSEVDMPSVPWLGRMRAKLEFARQCREGKEEIVVQTMRPELGPKVAPPTALTALPPYPKVAIYHPTTLPPYPPTTLLGP